MYLRKFSFALILSLMTLPTYAEDGSWFVRPYVGLSQMSNLTATSESVGSADGSSDIQLDSGFTAGFGVGYQYNENWAAELAWEYRSNDSEVTLPDGKIYTDGNYASNIFFISGFYYFKPFSESIKPYIGAGLSWIQEVDIDLEEGGTELSYSGDGDLGFQLFAGIEYTLSDRWALQTELRYGSTGEFDLQGEESTTGKINGLDYEPFTLQVGAKFNF